VAFVSDGPQVFGDTMTDPVGAALRWGCGVTGLDRSDALARMRRELFATRPMPSISRITADIDVSTLDATYVLPFIGNPAKVGVWFPAIE
jgi:hypothetical protein